MLTAPCQPTYTIDTVLLKDELLPVFSFCPLAPTIRNDDLRLWEVQNSGFSSLKSRALIFLESKIFK